MEPLYDLWHLAFANLIQQRAPPNVEVLSEVRLTIEPQRADLLLLRRTGAERRDGEARVLHAIWPRLAKVTVVEFKSPTKSSFRPGDLIRLWGYGPLYHAANLDEISAPADLTLLLVVPSITPTLRDEIETMGWDVVDLGGGYRRIDGAVYALYVAVTDEVAAAEHDGFLRLFSHLRGTDPEASRWVRHWVKETTMTQKIEDMPGYEDIFEKILEDLPPKTRMLGLTPKQRLEGLAPEQRLEGLAPEQRLAGLAPEQRLAGLAPEQRLEGLAPKQRLEGLAPEQRLEGLAPEQRLEGLTHEEQILALSDELLRRFPDTYLSTLPAEVQEALRRRIGRPAPAGGPR